MKRFTLILCMLVTSQLAYSQYIGWDPVVMPNDPQHVVEVYTDTSNNSLYFCGRIREYQTNVMDSLLILKYQNGLWEHMGYFNHYVNSVVVYHDTLFAAGVFTKINEIPYSRIAKWDGSNWLPAGEFDGSINKLRVLNNELYAVGGYDTIDGTAINAVAKLNGSTWTSLHELTLENGQAYDICIYQNDPYVCGNFNFNGGLNDLMAYSNGSWQQVGMGIHGGFTGLFTLDTFQNELYVGGLMSIQDGNAGHGIQKWDGTDWSMVGNGLQDSNNGTNGWAAVYDLEVYQGELYASGGFMHAGHVRAEAIAKWDGIRWCGLGFDNSLSAVIESFAFYEDSIYIAAQHALFDSTLFTNAKRPVSLPPDTCGTPTSIEEHAPSGIVIYPNPSAGRIAIKSVDPGMYSLEVIDLTGRVVFSEGSIIGQSDHILDLAHLSSGTYLLSLQSGVRRYVQQIMLE